MIIIVLKGKANSGKTSSLKKLMLKLLEYPDVRVIYSSKYGTKSPAELSAKILEKWYTKSKNVSDITLLLNINNKKILITSMGDCLNDICNVLDDKLNRFGDINVFICGRHHNNNIETEFSRYSIEIPIVINKSRTNKENYENDNCNTGQELFNEVEKIVNQ